MTPTRLNFLWTQRAKARARLEGQLFKIQTEAHSNTKSQSFTLERVIRIDMQKALPLALLCLALAYAGAAFALQYWLERHAYEPATEASQIQTTPVTANHASPSVDAVAESVESSARKRIELVENETAFFKNLDVLQKAGGDDEILSNLSLARRRSPSWFLRRQTELTQLEISITARQGDLLALRGAASAYLNGTNERAEILTTAAQHLLEEKRTEAAHALLEEIIRKAPDYGPSKYLLKNGTLPPKDTLPE
jgi:hypothetical protein